MGKIGKYQEEYQESFYFSKAYAIVHLLKLDSEKH